MITCWSVPLPAATHHQPQLPDALKHFDAPTTVTADGPRAIARGQLACYPMEASVLVNGATLEEVEAAIADAIPPGIPPFTVLTCRTTRQGVEVSPGGGEPVAPIQRAALDAIRLRWPK